MGAGDPPGRRRVISAAPMVDRHRALGRGLTGRLGHQHLLPEGDLRAVEGAAQPPSQLRGAGRENGGGIVAVRIIVPDLGGGIRPGIAVKNIERAGPEGRSPAIRYQLVPLRHLVAIVRPARCGKTDLGIRGADHSRARPVHEGVRRAAAVVDPGRGGIGVPGVVAVGDGNNIGGGLGRINVKDHHGPGTVGAAARITVGKSERRGVRALSRGYAARVETPAAAVPSLVIVEGHRRAVGSDRASIASVNNGGRSGDGRHIGAVGGGNPHEPGDGLRSRGKVHGDRLAALGSDHDIVQARSGKGRELCLRVGIGRGWIATGANVDRGRGVESEGDRSEKEDKKDGDHDTKFERRKIR